MNSASECGQPPKPRPLPPPKLQPPALRPSSSSVPRFFKLQQSSAVPASSTLARKRRASSKRGLRVATERARSDHAASAATGAAAIADGEAGVPTGPSGSAYSDVPAVCTANRPLASTSGSSLMMLGQSGSVASTSTLHAGGSEGEASWESQSASGSDRESNSAPSPREDQNEIDRGEGLRPGPIAVTSFTAVDGSDVRLDIAGPYAISRSSHDRASNESAPTMQQISDALNLAVLSPESSAQSQPAQQLSHCNAAADDQISTPSSGLAHRARTALRPRWASISHPVGMGDKQVPPRHAFAVQAG